MTDTDMAGLPGQPGQAESSPQGARSRTGQWKNYDPDRVRRPRTKVRAGAPDPEGVLDLGQDAVPPDREGVAWRFRLGRSTGWATQRVSPMAGLTLVREEGQAIERALAGLPRRQVYDPYPGPLDLARALAVAEQGLEVLGPPPAFDPLELDSLPSPVLISACPRGRFGEVAVHSIVRGAKFLALFTSAAQLSGEGRWIGLYRRWPPARVWLYSSARVCRSGGKPGGSPSYWIPGLWAVWDGEGRPIKEALAERAWEGPRLGWIPDREVVGRVTGQRVWAPEFRAMSRLGAEVGPDGGPAG